eukprot:942309-Prorocentrum_lima.AAC.1
MFCNKAQLQKALATPRGCGSITRCLKTFRSYQDTDSVVYARALARLEEAAENSAILKHFVKTSEQVKRTKCPG